MNCFRVLPLFLCAVVYAQDTTRTPGWVVLPVEQYRTLRAAAFPPAEEPEKSPVDAILTRVEYDLRAGVGTATGRATLTIDVQKNGYVRVPIPAGLFIRDTRLDGRHVALLADHDTRSVLLSKAGRAVLTLDIALPLAYAAGDETLALPAARSGVTRAAIALQRTDVDVRVSGGLLADRSTAGDEMRLVAYARGSEALTLSWRRRTVEERRVEQPLRLRASMAQLFSLGEDATSIAAEVGVAVSQGAARELHLSVPDGVTINQVSGANLGDWDVKAGTLAVTFLEPVTRNVAFTVAAEARLPREGSIALPLLRIVDGERESGSVAVDVLGAGEIRDVKAQNLEAADAADLGGLITARQSPSLVAFRMRPSAERPARALTVELTRYAEQAVLTANIDEARYRVLLTPDGKSLIEARYAVRNNQRNFIRVALPAGAVVWSAVLDGRSVRPGRAPDGSLLFPLSKGRGAGEAAAFPVEVIYLAPGAAWNDKGQGRVTLPALDIPVSRTGLVMHYPPGFHLTPESGAFRADTFERPSSPALNGPVEVAINTGAAFQRLEQFAKLSSSSDATQLLVDRFRARPGPGRRVPPAITYTAFPAAGPSLFFVAELTGENSSPALVFSYQRDRKGGAR